MLGFDEHHRTLSRLLGNNRAWAERVNKEHWGFFEKLARQQVPEVFWIGCCNSRLRDFTVAVAGPDDVDETFAAAFSATRRHTAADRLMAQS